jgi:hypothetical protein
VCKIWEEAGFTGLGWQVGNVYLTCVGGLDARVVGHLHDDAVGGGLAMLDMVANLQEMTSASIVGDGGSRFGGERGIRVGRHVVANIVKTM